LPIDDIMSELAINPVKIGTLRRLTAGHPFFAGWDVERLKALETFCQVVDVPAAVTVMDLGAVDPYAYILLDGEVGLDDSAGRSRAIRAGDLDAGFPIAHLRPSRYRVRACPGTRLIRIEGSRLKRVTARRRARFLVAETSVGGSWRSHPLLATLIRQMRERQLQVPSMPGIAVRIRRALSKDHCDMADIAAIVGADPGIAGRLIRVANSAALGGRSPCESVQAALVRLGVERAQNLVLVLASRDLFRATSGFLNERMVRCWRRALDIAALAGVLARLTPGLDGDQGLLVGLLHEIGALPILRLAEDYPDLADQPLVLDEILSALTPEVSAEALAQWGMPEVFRQAALNQGNWFRDHDGHADYTDVLVVAHLHRLVRERTFHHLPRIDETPAFGKLALGLLSPQLSLLVLDEARSQVQELKTLLS
jgi:HD-like signal output (HDOD) protein